MKGDKMVKAKFTIYIDQELLEWVEDQVRERKFKSINDGIRNCIQECMWQEGKHDEA